MAKSGVWRPYNSGAAPGFMLKPGRADGTHNGSLRDLDVQGDSQATN